MAGAFPGVVWLDSGCTGVLMDEDTVLYAAHCGDGATEAWLGDQLEIEVDEVHRTTRVLDGADHVHIPIEFCELHPDAQLGQATDIAFCHLAMPALKRELLPSPLLGCERAALKVDQPVTMVGYGFEPVGKTAGTKMLAQTSLTWAITVLIAGDAEHGSCGGDSGGPLFVRTDALNPSWPLHWRLAGILSSGSAGETCGSGRYVDLAAAIEWFETKSGRDLSPCGAADGSWNPSPRCRAAALDSDGVPIADAAPEFSDTCGAPFEPEIPDLSPPTIDSVVVQDLGLRDGQKHLNVLPTVSDQGWGVERVEFEFLDAQGTPLSNAKSQLSPYELQDVGVPAGSKTIRLTATDYAGLSATRDEPVLLSHIHAEASCALGHAGAPRPDREPLVLTLAFAACATLGARKRAGASTRRRSTRGPSAAQPT